MVEQEGISFFLAELNTARFFSQFEAVIEIFVNSENTIVTSKWQELVKSKCQYRNLHGVKINHMDR